MSGIYAQIDAILNEAYEMNPIKFFDEDYKHITVQAVENLEKKISEQDMFNSSKEYLLVETAIPYALKMVDEFEDNSIAALEYEMDQYKALSPI